MDNSKQISEDSVFIQFYVLKLGNDYYSCRGGGILTSQFTQCKMFSEIEEAIAYQYTFDIMHTTEEKSKVIDVGAVTRPALLTP